MDEVQAVTGQVRGAVQRTLLGMVVYSLRGVIVLVLSAVLLALRVWGRF